MDGALEFARLLTEGLSREEAAPVIYELLSLDSVVLTERFGLRVKRCVICGLPFRDRTRPGIATICGSKFCETTKKSRQKAVQRGRMKQGVKKSIIYYWWLEYPLYNPHEAMMRRAYSYEKPFAPEKILQIAAAKERKERMGGRRKPRYTVEY